MRTTLRRVFLLLPVALFWSSPLRADLTPVTENDWGLKIVNFAVGQADCAVLLTPNGQAVIIDVGETKANGVLLADYLLDKNKNGVASGSFDDAK